MKNKTIHILTKTKAGTKALVLGSFLLAGTLHTIAAQNIANPDFETLTIAGTYPNGYGQMNRAASWTQPTTNGTCDYYYGPPNGNFRIAVSTTGSAPYNNISAQNGSAYVGGYAEISQSGDTNYKEYITNRLSTKLTNGVTYSITFYTMHLYGTSTTFPGFNLTDLIPSEQGFIGVVFSAVSPTNANVSTTGAAWSGGMLNSWNAGKRAVVPASNTAVYGAGSRNTWVPVTVTYTADGTEEYMTLGQLREAPTTMPAGNMVYYLYDNFSPTISPVASLSKKVFPNTISDGGTATYTFTINNTQSGSVALSGLSFTDTLPSGLKVASTPNVVVTGLTDGTTTAAAGGASVAASGYSIAANTTATITVNVTNAAGQTNASCGSNPAAFTNGSSNISGLSSNLVNNVTNVCLVITPCAAGGTAPVLSSN